jgi:hypothetical protein
VRQALERLHICVHGGHNQVQGVNVCIGGQDASSTKGGSDYFHYAVITWIAFDGFRAGSRFCGTDCAVPGEACELASLLCHDPGHASGRSGPASFQGQALAKRGRDPDGAVHRRYLLAAA